MPDHSPALIVAQSPAHIFINADFVKPGRIFGPCRSPANSWDEMSFVYSIPTVRTRFDEQKPDKRYGKSGSRQKSRPEFANLRE